MKSGNLNFLEHSGPIQASNGTDLPYSTSYEPHIYISLLLRSMILVLCLTWKLDKHGVWTTTDCSVDVRDVMSFEGSKCKTMLVLN